MYLAQLFEPTRKAPMKRVSSVIRICISAGAALAALAPRAGQAASQVCPGAGMAMFERDGGVSAVETGGDWLRILPGSGMLVTMASVEGLPPCVDPDFRVSPDGTQLITWPYDDEILSVTNNKTVATKLAGGEKLWAADVAFHGDGRAVIAALLYRDMDEPRLTLMVDSRPGAGAFGQPFEVTGAKCGAGTTAAGATTAGEVIVLCEGTFTIFNSYEGGFDLATFPLERSDRQLILAVPSLEPGNRVTFFAIVKDLTDTIDPAYELVRIRLSPDGGQRFDLVLDNVAYAGGDHGLAVINERNVVYMDEEGMRQVVGSTYETWATGVIHPLRPEAKLSAMDDPMRVLISEYDVEMLTLTDVGWENTTLFAVGMPPAAPPEKEDAGGCSAAGTDPATGLGQVLLVMLALALGSTLAPSGSPRPVSVSAPRLVSGHAGRGSSSARRAAAASRSVSGKTSMPEARRSAAVAPMPGMRTPWKEPSWMRVEPQEGLFSLRMARRMP
jgi:hypothetical protein